MTRSAALLFSITVLCLAAFSPARSEILVFAAASTKPAMDRVTAAYIKQNGETVRVSFASSGTLAQQIRAGAPADIFLSANVMWMDLLEEAGRLEPASLINLLTNRLAVIGPPGLAFVRQPTAREHLKSVAAQRGWIAIGDPRHVPAGMYAKAALEKMGLWQTLNPRLSRASNVRTVVVLVARGEADAGIVYESDAVSSRRISRITGIDTGLHPPIVYPMAMVKGHDRPETRRYVKFLQSRTAGEIFKRHGFGLK